MPVGKTFPSIGEAFQSGKLEVKLGSVLISFFSVRPRCFLWLTIAPKIHHRDTENTEDAQRLAGWRKMQLKSCTLNFL